MNTDTKNAIIQTGCMLGAIYTIPFLMRSSEALKEKYRNWFRFNMSPELTFLLSLLSNVTFGYFTWRIVKNN